MDIPSGHKYSREHEWVRVDEGGIATVGITDFAQDQLGDIVYLSLPEVGSQVRQFDKCGELESVKSVSDLYTPVGGEVVERNELAIDTPELVNQSPYGEGWLWQVRLENPAELENLLDAEAYEELTKDAGH
ncbi:MAG: glycine cleavage system protein GcvH [Dehalococcoidia bacterium]